jgi:hypothetical protein
MQQQPQPDQPQEKNTQKETPISCSAIKAIIFDLDGVLVDSRPLHKIAMNKVSI